MMPRTCQVPALLNSHTGATPLQATFRRWHAVPRPYINAASHAQCAPECLEQRFNLVMIILATNYVHVQGRPGVTGKAVEELRGQIDIEFSDSGALEVRMKMQARPTRKINYHA